MSKSDDEESPFSSTHEVGTKTLLGMNAADLLPKVQSHDAHDGIDIKSEDPISGVTVDDLFADSENEPPTISKPRASVDDTQVGTLLGEVAEALNVQAAESRQRALGRSSGPAARPPEKAKPEEFEFEDPDDGPTSLNAKGDVDGDDAASESNADDEEEAVVLGPARKSDKHASLSGPPGSRPAVPASTRPLPGTRRATPFAGLPSATLPTFPTPAGGRSRLPTPAPGQAVSIPAPAGAGGRSAPPPGRPSGAHAPLEGTGTPAAPASGRDSSRRTAAKATTPLGLDALEGNGAVGESLTASAMNTASTILKKDLRLKLASLAAIVVLTFVGGMLLGRSKSGDSKAEVAGDKSGGDRSGGDRSAGEPAKPAVAPAPPPAVAPAAVAQPANPPPAAPPAAPATNPAPVAVDPAAAAPADGALHKHRARRANPVAKDDVAAKVSAPKPAARPAAGFPAPAPAPKVAAKPASGSGGGKKAKAAWHDPFAD